MPLSRAARESVAYTRKLDCSPLIGHAIFDLKMTGLHSHAHAETVDRQHTALANRRFAGIRELR
jgi:hypothetical protein